MSRLSWPIRWFVVPAACGLAIACSLPAGQPEQGKGPAGKVPAKKAPGGIIISRETTFLTGPLRKDGTVDYVAALNHRYAQGVTPENNAVIPLVQAFGLDYGDKQFREQFFKMLGIAPLPEKGPYLEAFEAYFVRKSPAGTAPKDGQSPDVQEKAYKELKRIQDRPWSKKDSPIAAAWLEENQRQIDLIVAATKRPRFYAPLVAGRDEPGTVIALLLPVAQTVARRRPRLCARAMYRVAVGKSEEAWQDLLACHRLARLVDQATTLVDGLVAIAIEGVAIHGDAVLAHEGKLTAKQAARFAAGFRKLPPMSKMVDRLDWAERLMYLDCVFIAPCKGIGQVASVVEIPSPPEGKFASFVERQLTTLVDWNEPMRVGNRWYDRLVAALSKPTRKERDAAVAEFERDLKKLAAEVRDPRVLLRNIAAAGSLRGGLGRQIGNVFVALFMPALSACVNAEDRNTTWESMVPVVFALAAYRADHGAYPAELAALVPKYLPTVTEDPFSGGPLRYRRDGPGYVLYSVGMNGKDDGGRAYWDHRDGEDASGCDDIAIRVPAKKK